MLHMPYSGKLTAHGRERDEMTGEEKKEGTFLKRDSWGRRVIWSIGNAMVPHIKEDTMSGMRGGA